MKVAVQSSSLIARVMLRLDTMGQGIRMYMDATGDWSSKKRTRLSTGPSNPESETRLISGLSLQGRSSSLVVWAAGGADKLQHPAKAAKHYGCGWILHQGCAYMGNPSQHCLFLVLVPEPRVLSTRRMWQRPRAKRTPLLECRSGGCNCVRFAMPPTKV